MHWLRLALLPVVFANVEKVVFKAPIATTIPNTQPGLDSLCLDTLTSTNHTLNIALPVAFPSDHSPRGIDSWYLLEGLTEGQRHEVRVCWAAIQPTEFWLDTFTLSETFDSPELITALADFSEERARRGNCVPRTTTFDIQRSLAFLRVQAAADFYTTNRTLMRHPPNVQVDIILDPYIGSIIPRSLGPTGIYIIAVAIGSLFLSSQIWAFLANVSKSKPHTE